MIGATLLHLDLAVPTEWGRIDQVREAVSHCVAAVFDDGDLRDALAMVCAELLENAFKYGKPGQPDVQVTVKADDGRLIISVTNAIDEAGAHVKILSERVAWVKEFGDPLQAYQAALEQAFTDETDASGLGLARITYEGGCALDCDTSQAGRVTVRAACPLVR
jgi:hypothetical protein